MRVSPFAALPGDRCFDTMVPMTTCLEFTPFASDQRAACLALFDENCPDFFAPNEPRPFSTAVRRGIGLASAMDASSLRLAC
jgi:hypothetical protein